MSGNGDNIPVALGAGWFKAMRTEAARELMRRSPNAFCLAWIIAHRARFNSGFNADGLSPGEALIGDHDTYGLTRQEHRTALKILTENRFATIRATTKGTIATLIDTRLFDPLNITGNQPINQRPTSEQPSTNQRATTNLERKNGECKKAYSTNGPKKLSKFEKEIADRMESVLKNEWVNDAGKWVNRIKERALTCERVVAEVESAVKESRIKTTPARYAEQIWKEFKADTAKPNPRNVGVTIGPTDYGKAKPRAQREREAKGLD
jgi:hypothetical protein